MDSLIEQEIRRTAALAFEEDQVKNDITSKSCFPLSREISAHIVLKQKAVIAGACFLPLIFKELDPDLQVEVHVDEGQRCESGTIIASIKGSALSILCIERSALNIVQHATGIATTTALYVEEVKGYNCDILDTRKTLPGLRAMQKYAVTIGGGKNHRFHLGDRILIKNNHLNLLKKQTARPVFDAVMQAKSSHPSAIIEVEVEDLKMLDEALQATAHHIMLDNMDVNAVKDAVLMTDSRAYLEASGGMTLDRVKEFAKTGVNGISIGALTHSVTAIDMSLRVAK